VDSADAAEISEIVQSAHSEQSADNAAPAPAQQAKAWYETGASADAPRDADATPAVVPAAKADDDVPSAPSALSNAVSAPLVPQQISLLQEESEPAVAAAAAVVSAPAPTPAPAAPEASEAPAPVSEYVAQPAAAPEVEVAAPAAETLAPTVVTTPEAATRAAPVETAPAATAAPAPVSATADLQQVLQAAGLTLATTDPEKLRAAQQAAAQIVPAPRVPRERKPVAPISNEPLVQIETRRP
jgi:ribonuclease E